MARGATCQIASAQRRGVRPLLIQQQLGHSNLATTTTYLAHLTSHDVRTEIASIFGPRAEVVAP